MICVYDFVGNIFKEIISPFFWSRSRCSRSKQDTNFKQLTIEFFVVFLFPSWQLPFFFLLVGWFDQSKTTRTRKRIGLDVKGKFQSKFDAIVEIIRIILDFIHLRFLEQTLATTDGLNIFLSKNSFSELFCMSENVYRRNPQEMFCFELKSKVSKENKKWRISAARSEFVFNIQKSIITQKIWNSLCSARPEIFSSVFFSSQNILKRFPLLRFLDYFSMREKNLLCSPSNFVLNVQQQWFLMLRIPAEEKSDGIGNPWRCRKFAAAGWRPCPDQRWFHEKNNILTEVLAQYEPRNFFTMWKKVLPSNEF